MTKMVSPTSPPLLHIPRNNISHNTHRRPPTPSSCKSSPKPRKNNENSSSSRPGNHRRSNSNGNKNVVPPSSPLMSKRQAQVLDQWATQQARETLTTIENKNQHEFDVSSVAFRSRTPSRDPSPVPSDSSVSSLVQKWKKFETAETKQSAKISSNEPSVVHQVSAKDVEKDRVRVVDIIKKLPLVKCGESTTNSSNPALSSPRIRGRQAFSDLLSKNQRDRYTEINATSKKQVVSKFPKRGCLQSILKLRLLRSEVSTHDQIQQEPKSSTTSSSIHNLRQSFDTRIVDDNQDDEMSSLQNCDTNSKSHNQEKKQVEILDKPETSLKCNIRRQDEDETEKVVVQDDLPHSKTVLPCNEIGTSSSVSPETNNTSPSWEDENVEEMVCEEDQGGVYDETDFFEMNLDWINDISRPRSYWQSLRQAWYDQVFSSSSKTEIRQLIQRGSVSTVLASDFPEKMDRIMASSCLQQKANPIGNNVEEHRCIQEDSISNGEETRQELEQEFARQKDEEEGGVEPECSSSHQCNNGGYYYEQPQAPLSDYQWKNYGNQEDSDNSDQFESTLNREQSSVTNSYEQDTQGDTSVKNNSSIEMELVHDLRTHMEQMYREMSELRKSVNNCVDMQTKLQSSIKDEVSAALSYSGSSKAKGKEWDRKVPNKGCCCVCYEKKADSVMYRCGHMCACYKCAHELQWSSGKCPICRAQIVDVVRVFTDA